MKNIYYTLRPFIPRRLQIVIRRIRINHQRSTVNDVWPIDQMACKAPDNWTGWPEQKRFALVLMHDVETENGHDKVLRLMKSENRLGLRSSFNLVPKRYNTSSNFIREIKKNGFEVGVHGLKHDGKLFLSKRIFEQRAPFINYYLRDWNAVGFSSPSMHHNFDWMKLLDIEYATSTFDTDPFEPQPDGVSTIFPFAVNKSHIELPYTLPQDFTLFILMKEKTIDIWKKKLDWIAEKGGMALLNTHPDYMNCDSGKLSFEEYPIAYYEEFLKYVQSKYKGQYWHALPRDTARYCSRVLSP